MANRELLILIGYVVGAVVTGRLAYIYLFDRDVYKVGGINLMVLMLVWPMFAALAVVVAVVAGLIWLVTWEPAARRVSTSEEWDDRD